LSSTAELASLIERFAGGDGVHSTAIPRVFLHRASRLSEPLHTVYEPAVCFVAQGRKQAMAGQSIYVYDEAHYLVVSVDIPIVSQILDARPEKPFLCLRLDLDSPLICTLTTTAMQTLAGARARPQKATADGRPLPTDVIPPPQRALLRRRITRLHGDRQAGGRALPGNGWDVI
jgi:AraC-type transcriptional regulator N-terminus